MMGNQLVRSLIDTDKYILTMLYLRDTLVYIYTHELQNSKFNDHQFQKPSLVANEWFKHFSPKNFILSAPFFKFIKFELIKTLLDSAHRQLRGLL